MLIKFFSENGKPFLSHSSKTTCRWALPLYVVLRIHLWSWHTHVYNICLPPALSTISISSLLSTIDNCYNPQRFMKNWLMDHLKTPTNQQIWQVKQDLNTDPKKKQTFKNTQFLIRTHKIVLPRKHTRRLLITNSQQGSRSNVLPLLSNFKAPKENMTWKHTAK